MIRFIVATNNKGKLLELVTILTGLDAELITPGDVGLEFDVAETGQTYAENARLKAQAVAQAAGLVSLGDDSGLEVEALDGAPGLFSARYAGAGASDAVRRLKLMDALRAVPAPRRACFRCALAVAVPGGEVQVFEGACEGEIILEERGQNGFGYDPIFYMREHKRTMAELPPELKNQISHRGRATLAARPYLERLAREETPK
jgi:XTP/dITP diphosphohydrolase